MWVVTGRIQNSDNRATTEIKAQDRFKAFVFYYYIIYIYILTGYLLYLVSCFETLNA